MDLLHSPRKEHSKTEFGKKNSEQKFAESETFSGRKISPATGVRCDEVFSERTRILSGIQFTRHFIEFVLVETKQFIGSDVNVILTRRTCGQR